MGMARYARLLGAQVHFDMGAKQVIGDAIVLYQLNDFAVQNGLTSPLWLAPSHAAALQLDARPMCSPVNLWLPFYGTQYIALPRMSKLWRRIPRSLLLRAHDTSREEFFLYNRTVYKVDDDMMTPCWHPCPDALRDHFYAAWDNKAATMPRFWIAASLLPEAERGGVVVRAPFVARQVLNVDQLVPCDALVAAVAAAYDDAAAALRPAGTPNAPPRRPPHLPHTAR